MARTEYGTTWWGKRWLDALSGIDLENRIPRGKTYANTGRVLSLHLDFDHHQIKARVAGHYDPFYQVKIELPPISQKDKDRLVDKMADNPLIVARLAARELSPEIAEIAEKLHIKIFPKSWNDFNMTCSCPDWAVPCKHIAAVIYKISEEIDANPFILFSLRGIDLIEEMQARHIEIGRAEKVEMPKWDDLICEIPNPEIHCEFETQDWLGELKRLSFQPVENQREAIDKLFSDQPAGYIHGSLKAVMQKVLTGAAKLAKEQMKSKIERSTPEFDEAQPLICINSWGQPIIDESLSWLERTALNDRNRRVKLKQPSRTLPLGRSIHEMFSGFITNAQFENKAAELEALYDIWLIATRLVQQGAIVPQIYEPIEDVFAIRWIPAVMTPAVAELTEKVGRAFSCVSADFFRITKHPHPIDPQSLGEVILGLFIQSYVKTAYTEYKNKRAEQIDDHEAFFAFKPVDCSGDNAAEAMRLRFEGWITPLFVQKQKVQAVLIVHDFIADATGEKTRLEKREDALELPVGIELGFNLVQAKESAANTIPLAEVMRDPEYRPIRFDCLKTVSQLTHFYPEIGNLVKNALHIQRLTMQQVAPLIFDALPTLRLLGVKVVLPKALRSLLQPTSSLSMDVIEPWDEGTGLMGLMSLLEFNWQLAIGDKTLSEAEFNRLCKSAGQVVFFNDSYVYVDPQEIAAIKRRLAAKAELTKANLLQAALSGKHLKSPVLLGDRLKVALQKLFEEKEFALPKSITATLRPYQQRGFNWLMRNIRLGLGSIIADDMGLGKTLQVICALDKLREEGQLEDKQALIVVPTSLLMNWQREVAKFAPQLKLSTYYGQNRRLSEADGHIILTTYGVLRTSAKALAKKSFRAMVIDEAQAIKNHTTGAYKTVKSFKPQAFIAMSGTPVENRLMEYWSVMDAANPGLLGSPAFFQQHFVKPIEHLHDLETVERFKRLTAPFILRRMKTDKSIINDLPDKVNKNEYCRLTKEQTVLYQAVVKKELAILDKATDQFERQARVLQLILKLKKICNAPAHYEPKAGYTDPVTAGKMQRLFDILDDLQAAGRKALIFTQFKQMGELLQTWIAERYGKCPAFIHGGVRVTERQKLVDDFQTKRDEKVMVLSLKAAGTGLNLTAASAVIHYDLWWNPAVENQATDRAYRIGQKQTVNVYRFISADTFEEKIDKIIQSKKELAEMTVSVGESWLGDLSNKELNDIFTLTDADSDLEIDLGVDSDKATKNRTRKISNDTIIDVQEVKD